jgi:glycosyltransferase involved in cell wall biosynthesis
MVGNFVTEKDQYYICHFLKELSERDVPFEFYFVGREVPAYKKCFNDCVTFCENNGLSDRVHFTGVRNDIPQLLCQMDAFIYASKSETFGLAPVEAIAVGLPTFLNDLDVFVEIAKDGQYAILYKSGDVQDLYSKFQDFSRNRQSYYDRAMVNASAIRNIYSISTHINGLFSLYSQIMS